MASVMFFTIINYLLIKIDLLKICLSKDPTTTMPTVSSFCSSLTSITFLWLIVVSIVTGFYWGIISPRILYTYYRLQDWITGLLGKSSYNGDKPLWDIVLHDNQGKWCDVYLKSGKIFKCQIINRSTFPDKEGLYIASIHEISGDDLIKYKNGVTIFIQGAEIQHIEFHPLIKEKKRDYNVLLASRHSETNSSIT